MWRPQDKEAVLREVHLREWRARVGRRTLAFFRWLGSALVKGFVAMLVGLKNLSAKTAHDVEVSRLLSQRYDKLLQLGEIAYSLFRSGNLSWTALAPLCEEIERIDRQLEAAQNLPLQVVPSEATAMEEQSLGTVASP